MNDDQEQKQAQKQAQKQPAPADGPLDGDCQEALARLAHSERSRRLVAAMIDALNDHVIEGQEAFWHPDMHWYGPAGIGTKSSLKAFQEEHQRPFLHAFPDKQATDEVRIAEGDWVAAFGYQEATHAGDYLGIPASGKRVKVRYMDFWRVEDGKLKENWVMIDLLDFLEQLGVDIHAMLADAMRYRRGDPADVPADVPTVRSDGS